jgi:hypothetical protein
MAPRDKNQVKARTQPPRDRVIQNTKLGILQAVAAIDLSLSSSTISKKVNKYLYKFTNDFNAKYRDDHLVVQKFVKFFFSHHLVSVQIKRVFLQIFIQRQKHFE